MNAREMKTPEDVLLGWIQGSNERVARINAQKAISDLDEAGFVILPRSEVEAIRDKALEEAAEIAQYIPTPADVQDHMLRLGYISASQAIATAIRKLKSGGRDG